MDIPDLSGVWNGLRDNLNGVPNQMANVGISVESETLDATIFSAVHKIATFPRNTEPRGNNGGRGRTCRHAAAPNGLQ